MKMLELLHLVSIANSAIAQSRAVLKPAWSVQLPYMYSPQITENAQRLFLQFAGTVVCIDKSTRKVKWSVKRRDEFPISEIEPTIAVDTYISARREKNTGEFIDLINAANGQSKGTVEFPGYSIEGYRTVGAYLLICIRSSDAQSAKVGVIDLRTTPAFSDVIPLAVSEALPDGPITFGGELFWIRSSHGDDGKGRSITFERDDISWKALGKKYVQERVVLMPGNETALVLTGGELIPRPPDIEPSDRDVRKLISLITIKDDLRQRLWTLEYVRNEFLSPPVTQFAYPIFIGKTAHYAGYQCPLNEPWIMKPTPQLRIFRAGKRILALKSTNKPGASKEIMYLAKNESFKHLAYLPIVEPDKESGVPFHPYWTETGFMALSLKGGTTIGTWYALPK